jgi:hypothetical protein
VAPADVLGVPPVTLLFPLGSPATVKVLPGREVPPGARSRGSPARRPAPPWIGPAEPPSGNAPSPAPATEGCAALRVMRPPEEPAAQGQTPEKSIS